MVVGEAGRGGCSRRISGTHELRATHTNAAPKNILLL